MVLLHQLLPDNQEPARYVLYDPYYGSTAEYSWYIESGGVDPGGVDRIPTGYDPHEKKSDPDPK